MAKAAQKMLNESKIWQQYIMSTNSTIVLKLHERDKGKRKKANFKKVPHRVDFDELDKLSDRIPSEENFNKNIKSFVIPKDANYMEIYHHWDGYPNSLGVVLNEEFNTYEKIFQLMLGGDCSTVIDGVMQYTAITNIDWENARPTLSSEIPQVTQRFQYLFDEEKGKWLYREDDKHKWKDIKRYRDNSE